jgi:hypothetical protein
MGLSKRAVYAPAIVGLCVIILAATQVLARQRNEEPVRNYAAGPSEITLPVVDPATPDPTADPTARPRRQVAEHAPVHRAAPAAVQAPAPQLATSSGPADKIALLIGIDHAPGSTPLEGAITDANNMNKALLDFGFQSKNIVKLTDKSATRQNILNALSSFASRSKSNGIAVFLLATHSGRSGGDLTFATGGGGRISRHELAAHLGRVKGKLWSTLPTCYSGGYALPGVVGKNRIAVFSSTKGDLSWFVGNAGSWIVRYMVRYGLLEHRASDTSVEGAFRYAKSRLLIDAPDRTPIINDQIPGNLVLGKSRTAAPAAKPKPKPKPVATAVPTPVPVPTQRPCGLLGGLFGCR